MALPRPSIALAPGMGIGAFFAFTVVLTYKYHGSRRSPCVLLGRCSS
jgi:xanthine/uracil/vitamin C permease (AzgA family)